MQEKSDKNCLNGPIVIKNSQLLNLTQQQLDSTTLKHICSTNVINSCLRNKCIIAGERYLINRSSFYWLKPTRISLIKWLLKVLLPEGRIKMILIIHTVSDWYISTAGQQHKTESNLLTGYRKLCHSKYKMQYQTVTLNSAGQRSCQR